MHLSILVAVQKGIYMQQTNIFNSFASHFKSAAADASREASFLNHYWEFAAAADSSSSSKSADYWVASSAGWLLGFSAWKWINGSNRRHCCYISLPYCRSRWRTKLAWHRYLRSFDRMPGLKNFSAYQTGICTTLCLHIL